MAQITRLAPFGMSMRVYGSFGGKAQVTELQLNPPYTMSWVESARDAELVDSARRAGWVDSARDAEWADS